MIVLESPQGDLVLDANVDTEYSGELAGNVTSITVANLTNLNPITISFTQGVPGSWFWVSSLVNGLDFVNNDGEFATILLRA